MEGEKLLEASLLRSWEDRNLLERVLVLKNKTTDLLTLAATELAFRNLVGRYATALALPSPFDKDALVILGAKLAQEMYNIVVSPPEVLAILNDAIRLCEDD